MLMIKIRAIFVLSLVLVVSIVTYPPFAAAVNESEAIQVGKTVTARIVDWNPTGSSEYGTNTTYDVRITLLSVIRGNKAWDLIQAASETNRPPEAGFEYLLVRIRIACDAMGDSAIPYKVKPDVFKVYDTTNHGYASPAVLPPELALIGRVFRSNDVREGWIPFLVAKDHKRLFMFFSGGLWFQLFDQ